MPWLRFLERHPWLLAVGITLVIAADAWALTRSGSTSVPLAEAVSQFHQEAGLSPQPAADEPAPAGTPSDPPPTTSAPRPDAATAAPGASGPVPPTADAPPPALRPAAGVYRYRTDGFERLSVLGAHRAYPRETTRIVRHGQGCAWTMRVLLAEEHEEEHSACGTSTRLDVTGNATTVQWFGLSFTTQLACDPGIRHADRGTAAGTAAPFVCREEDGASTFAGTTTFVGEEGVRVGSELRDAWRIRIQGSFTGRTRGTVAVTELVDKERGAVLFEQRVNELQHPTLLGDVTYRQEVTLVLISLSPLA